MPCPQANSELHEPGGEREGGLATWGGRGGGVTRVRIHVKGLSVLLF